MSEDDKKCDCGMPLDDNTACKCNEEVCVHCCECDKNCDCKCSEKAQKLEEK